MRFTVKRISSVKIILAKQYAQIVLPRIYNSGDQNSSVFNSVKRNMLVAQQYTQICLKTCQCLNRGALFRETAKRFQVL